MAMRPLETTKNQADSSHLKIWWSACYFKMTKGTTLYSMVDGLNSLPELVSLVECFNSDVDISKWNNFEEVDSTTIIYSIMYLSEFE